MFLFNFLILILILLFFGAFFDAPWAITRKKDFDRIAKLARLQPGMVFCDLGSGDARMLFYLSKKYKVKCVGIEISPFLYLYSKFKSLFCNGKVKILYGNFYKYNLSEADVIYVFLFPKTHSKLKKKLDSEAKKGARIILSCWPFKNLEPVAISKKRNEITYWLYVV